MDVAVVGIVTSGIVGVSGVALAGLTGRAERSLQRELAAEQLRHEKDLAEAGHKHQIELSQRSGVLQRQADVLEDAFYFFGTTLTIIENAFDQPENDIELPTMDIARLLTRLELYSPPELGQARQLFTNALKGAVPAMAKIQELGDAGEELDNGLIEEARTNVRVAHRFLKAYRDEVQLYLSGKELAPDPVGRIVGRLTVEAAAEPDIRSP